MSYSTTAQIRDEAGFTNNSNISDAQIDTFRNQAYWLVVSWISGVYNISNLSWNNFTWSTAEYMLQRIEILFGAWYLLLDQYWNNDLWSWKTPFNRIYQAEAMLSKIVSWETRLVWLDWVQFDRIWKSTSGWVAKSNTFIAWQSHFTVWKTY